MISQDEKLQFKKNLENRTKKFAVMVFKYLDCLPNANSSRVIAYQLGKSASSVGANYREANRGESMDDFAHKLAIVLKECSESHYWLGILLELHPESAICKKLLAECEELLRLFQSAERKTRLRQRETIR